MTDSVLSSDRQQLAALLGGAMDDAVRFLESLDERPVAHVVPAIAPLGLPARGLGTAGALEAFRQRYAPWVSASAGPRYFAFVTGGSTPAALVGDWLTSVYDQNGSDAGESSARHIALDALAMVRGLIGLPDEFQGAFVTGATTSAIVALATARQWVGHSRGVDASVEGAQALGPVRILSGTAHSSISKAASVIGLGRSALHGVAMRPSREAIDVDALSASLQAAERDRVEPVIVVANAGTVNTCDFDDLRAIGELKSRHAFWLHVDGAFGAIAAASPRYRALLDGLEAADSVSVDGHKWLNVPYDNAVVLTRHLGLQGETFRSSGAYLPAEVRPDTLMHLTPENSQRLRALTVWMTLAAYGRAGYAEIVERCCAHAAWLGARIEGHPMFRLLAPVKLNGICFTVAGNGGDRASAEEVTAFLERLKRGGVTFLTPTTLRGVPAARVSISNWRTDHDDMERTWGAIQEAVRGRRS